MYIIFKLPHHNHYVIPTIKRLLFLGCTLLFSHSIFGQYVSHYTLEDKIKTDTLTDQKSGDKFFIDKNRIYITAIDKNGKILWKTDPVMDNRIKSYKTNRPTIVYFAFGVDESKHKNVIWITYNTTLFGTLNKRTGKFNFLGED